MSRRTNYLGTKSTDLGSPAPFGLGLSLTGGCRNDFLGGIGQIGGGSKIESAILEQLPPLGDIRSFQSDDERNGGLYFLEGGDDRVGNDIALHDAAENVDENRLYAGIRQEDA